jgi:hypothetical protein
MPRIITNNPSDRLWFFPSGCPPRHDQDITRRILTREPLLVRNFQTARVRVLREKQARFMGPADRPYISARTKKKSNFKAPASLHLP